MKIALSFLVIYIGCIFVIDVSSQQVTIDKVFRRFEILVTGLRHTNYYYPGTLDCCPGSQAGVGCTSPCNRNPLIIINNLPAITTPPIGSNIPPPGGDYVYNNVWEDDDDNRIFQDYLNISISITNVDSGRVLGSGKLELLRFSPNTDKQWRNFQLGDNIKVNIHLSFWCRSYTGYNCQFKYDEDDHSVETDFRNGDKYCANGNIDPNNCSNTYDGCQTNPCQNNADCHKLYFGNTYCICKYGFSGQYCQYAICVEPCHPEFGECVNGKCVCLAGWESSNCSVATCNGWNQCQNKGECIVKFNDHTCNCNPLKYSGEYCEYECLNECIFGTCIHNGTNSSCICYEGYQGLSCDEIVVPKAAIFESGYVSKYKQTAIIVGVLIALIIIAILVFGLGSYLRKNATRNIKVTKRAQHIVNTLKRESMMNPGFNAI